MSFLLWTVPSGSQIQHRGSLSVLYFRKVTSHCVLHTVAGRSHSSCWQVWSSSFVRQDLLPHPSGLQLQMRWASLPKQPEMAKLRRQISVIRMSLRCCRCAESRVGSAVISHTPCPPVDTLCKQGNVCCGVCRDVCCCIHGNTVAKDWNSSEAPLNVIGLHESSLM